MTLPRLPSILYHETVIVYWYIATSAQRADAMPATKDEIATRFTELAFRYGYRRTAVEDVARELRISK